MRRTTYQRGNRDGLLNAAAEMDAHVYAYEQRAEATRRSPVAHRASSQILLAHDCRAASTYRDVAARLRRLAEALPEDPSKPLAEKASTR